MGVWQGRARQGVGLEFLDLCSSPGQSGAGQGGAGRGRAGQGRAGLLSASTGGTIIHVSFHACTREAAAWQGLLMTA